MLPTSWFNYDLPDELIARFPAEKRDCSRMLVLDRHTGKMEIRPFGAIVEYLERGDALIRNNTKVLSGRMYGRKKLFSGEAGAHFELLLLEPAGPAGVWQVMLKPGKRALPGTEVVLTRNQDDQTNPWSDQFEVLQKNPDATYLIKFSNPNIDLMQERYGKIPLPPYLRRQAQESDRERYQTVYAKNSGAVAAPTAGLHFTEEIFSALQQKGVNIGEVTLHVGAGTFLPVSTEDATLHHMHTEKFVLPEETAKLINSTHAAGHRVLAVGTTSVRVMESCASPDGLVAPKCGATDIFLYPPYRPRSVDMLLTNFHLPKSTLLMLVSCFCDREKVLAAYEYAKSNRMRFYSYGDCMLLK